MLPVLPEPVEGTCRRDLSKGPIEGACQRGLSKGPVKGTSEARKINWQFVEIGGNSCVKKTKKGNPYSGSPFHLVLPYRNGLVAETR